VSLYLAEILFLSSLDLVLLRVEVSIDLGKGFLRNPYLLILCGRGLLPLCKLPLSRKEQHLQLLNHSRRRRRHCRARRRRWW
jgi:hypothetical protein